ncbi:hypothetical protein [[Clostridium] fimetarium]|uniref:Chemotaxis phosphatase CheX n=1 Tax=[Clostridium] fimetarium TaxID=99656 RepID=A0A1I0MQG8_9FIRM|nr:hypothetical protein [[Clostridium] fimetarium]SEV90202.1 hypothetical protein SAMN05421659_10220 [[Clostridium] fimetarium]
MFAQFFANYLLEENYIEKRQLIEGLKKMKNSRVKLGVLAIDAGYLTAAQVEKVHARQAQVDKRIGDIAVELGYLTNTQVEKLLSNQPARYLLLSQSLLDKEYMTNSKLEEALTKFKAKYNLSEEDMSDSQKGDKLSSVIKAFYKLDDSNTSKYIGTYIKLLFNNLVRFVGDDFVAVSPERMLLSDNDIKVSQKISGEFSTLTFIQTDEISLLQFVSRYAGEDIPVLDDYSIAAAQDFLNLHNGLFMVNMSNDSNIELKLAPPEIANESISQEKSYVCIPIMLTFGTINFILGK